MTPVRFALLLCAAVAAYSLPISEDDDFRAIGGGEGDRKLKQTVCVTLEDKPTSITQDNGELRQMFLIKTILGRNSDSAPRQFKFKILTVDDGPVEVGAPKMPVNSTKSETSPELNKQISFNPGYNNGMSLLNATVEQDFRELENIPRENVLRTAGSVTNTNNITDATTSSPDFGNLESVESSTSSPGVRLGQNNSAIFQLVSSNKSGSLVIGSNLTNINASINTNVSNDLHTVNLGIGEHVAANQSTMNNATQNETRTNILDANQTISFATKNENSTAPSNHTSDTLEFNRISPSTVFNETINDKSNASNTTNTSISMEVFNSAATADGNTSKPIPNFNESLPLNFGSNQTSNETIDNSETTIGNTSTSNSTISDVNENSTFTPVDSIHNFAAVKNENLTLVSDSLSKINSSSDEGEHTKTTVPEYPSMITFGNSSHNQLIVETKKNSTFNNSEAVRHDKALFSDRPNVTIPGTDSDDLEENESHTNDEIGSSTFSTPSRISSPTFSNDVDGQPVSNHISTESRTLSDPATTSEEFTELPSTIILTSTTENPIERTLDQQTEKVQYSDRTEAVELSYKPTIGAAHTDSTGYTTTLTRGLYDSNGSTEVPGQRTDWTRKTDEYSPSEEETDAPAKFGELGGLERHETTGDDGSTFVGTESSGYHKTFRLENAEGSQASVGIATTQMTTLLLAGEGNTSVETEGYNATVEVTAVSSLGNLLNKTGKALIDEPNLAAEKQEQYVTIMKNGTVIDNTGYVVHVQPSESPELLNEGVETISENSTVSPQRLEIDENGQLIQVDSLESTENPEEEEVVSEKSTVSPQGIKIDEDGKLIQVDSLESTENPEEEEVVSEKSTVSPQGIEIDEDGKLIQVDSLESTENPEEEEIISENSTVSPQRLEIDENGQLIQVDSPESTENPEEEEVVSEKSTVSPQGIEIDENGKLIKVGSLESTENPEEEEIVDKNFSTTINSVTSEENKTGKFLNLGPDSINTLDEDVTTKLPQESETDRNEEVVQIASIGSTENPDENALAGPTEGFEANHSEEVPHDVSTDNTEGQVENHDESEESIDAGSVQIPTTDSTNSVQQFQKTEAVEYITATPPTSSLEKLKIENVLAPEKPSVDESDFEFPTDAPPKHSPVPLTFPTSLPTVLPPSIPSGSTSLSEPSEDWDRFNNFTVVFPTRPSFIKRIVYDEEPSLFPQKQFPNFYRRYDYPGRMQIVPLELPRRQW